MSPDRDSAATTPAAPGPVTMRLHYTYDDANRRIGLTLPDGQQQSWGYDPAGRVNGVIQPGGGSWTVAHNGAGQPTMAGVPNGGSQVWGYDTAGRPTSATWLQAGNPTFSQVATLDPAGRRKGLADSWGTVTYGYDRAGRLTSAAYPDGSSEADSYNPAGNRTGITATTPLSGTVATTNGYDAADQLSTSAVTSGPQLGTTTYGYDGNGNQTGSSGPAGTTSNTFNDLNQLTRIVGPGTNLTLLYDGQGDRLRSYERGTPTWTLRNEAQDIVQGAPGGLSALVSDGTADYAYLSPGDGSAPLSSYTPATSRATYLGTDLLGSVRLATDPAGATIGSGAYDAWGVARPYAGGSGATQLAGLQGVAPFGYAGQQRDAGPGTYAMRARRYDPTQGRFQSQDPLAYSPQVPVTINPYEYAGNMPTGVTDPSGMGWVWPGQTCCFADYQQQSLIGGQAEGITPAGSVAADGYAGLLQRALGGGADTHAFWVPVLKHSAVATCHQAVAWTQPWLLANTYNANVVDLRRHQYWDIEHAGINSRATAGHLREIVQLARTNGMLWPSDRCNHFAEELRCAGSTRVDPGMELGTSFPPAANLPPGAEVIPLGNGVQGIMLTVPYRVDRALLAWQQAPGLILYIVVLLRTTPLCTGLVNCLFGAARVLVLDDFKTLFYSDAPWYDRGLAAVGVVGDVFFVAKLAKFGGIGARFARAAGTARLGAALGTDLRTTLRAAYDAWRATCGRCFPAGTGVATAKGTTAIERLKVGDMVLAEDPKTGTVEPEAVQAVIDDGVKPLIALDISDGSTLKVTGDHPFWVDGGSGLDHPGWLEAGQLRPGDRLRTADGHGVTVLALHWNAGEAHVYTLTIAKDHTFFVGSAQVLVHNAGPCGLVPYGSTDLSKAVQAKRIEKGDKLGNYAAGKLEDGTILYGRSSGIIHSEEDVLAQAGNRRIVDLYSEREPCAARCAALVEGINVTWSWYWNGVDRKAVNDAIRIAVRDLFK